MSSDLPIPTTRDIREEEVATLKELTLPNVCWLGDSFADQFRWQNGVSPAHKRPDVVDTDAFGSNEFVDFIRQIRSNVYFSRNIGSGTPQEAAEWLE